MHMANAPGAPTAAPFSPGAPDPGVGLLWDIVGCLESAMIPLQRELPRRRLAFFLWGSLTVTAS